MATSDLLSGTQGRAAASEWFAYHRGALGPLGVIIFAQLFFAIVAVDDSPLIGVSLSAYTTAFILELILDAAALFILLGLPLSRFTSRRTEGARVAAVSFLEGGDYGTFLLNYAAAGFAVLGIFWVVYHFDPAFFGAQAHNGVSVIQDMVFYGVFVGPTETLFFVIALPCVMPWWLAGGLVFPAYHLPIDAAGGALSDPTVLVVSFLERMAFGLAFFLIYSGWPPGSRSPTVPGAGPGATMAVHSAYDLAVVGAVAPLPLALVHLGLLPP